MPEEQHRLNSRRPVYVMLAVGTVVIVALTFAPYVLLSETRRVASAASRVVKTVARTPARPEIEPPRPAPPPFDVAAWYAGRGEEPATHGVLVESLDGAQVFASFNADAPFNPASLVKLATTLTALRRLGADYRFETRVFAAGTPDAAGVLRGKLYVAGGDPTFGDEAAGLIAGELRARGIRQVTDEIVVSPRFCFNFSNSPEESAARMAKALQLQPKRWSVGDPPPGAAAVTLRSYPLRAILLYMNAHSSNFVAERVGELVGGAAGVERFVESELSLPPDSVTLSTASGLEHNRMTPRGLLAVVRALDAEAGRQGLKLQDIMAVAGGDWGTLRRRLDDTPLASAAVAKTGTLVHDDGGMSSIGGVVYAQKSGPVAFVVLNQGSNVAQNKQLTDQLLVEIVLSQDLPLKLPQPDRPRHVLQRIDLQIEKK